MSLSKTLLRANPQLAGPPPELLAKVNNDLCDQSSDSGMFVSLPLGLLNVRSGEFRPVTAGPPAPVRLSQNGDVEGLTSPAGVGLGGRRGLPYASPTRQLRPGETLLFFTDGVSEALD